MCAYDFERPQTTTCTVTSAHTCTRTTGKLAADKITPQLRAKYDALLATSTPVERLHALGRHTDKQSGLQRADSHAGIAVAQFNGLGAHARAMGLEKLAKQLAVARPVSRRQRRITLKGHRIAEGRAKRAERDAKLASKRAKREARAAELVRLQAVPLATKYSELKAMRTEGLSDQLKVYKVRPLM